MFEVLNTIIERDAYNSILYSVLGGLLLLSIYHFVLFLQNHEKSYLLYSLYTFSSFLAYIAVTESGFLFDLSHYFHFDYRSKQFFTIIFNGLYFLFFANFLDIKKTNRNWYYITVYPIYCFIGIAIIGFLFLKLGNYEFIFVNFYKAFTTLLRFRRLSLFIF